VARISPPANPGSGFPYYVKSSEPHYYAIYDDKHTCGAALHNNHYGDGWNTKATMNRISTDSPSRWASDVHQHPRLHYEAIETAAESVLQHSLQPGDNPTASEFF